MAYFMESLHINGNYHVTTLCKITSEDDTFFYARPLKGDNFIRLTDRISDGKSEQHSHFLDTFEELEVHKEIKKMKSNNWGDYAWKFIDTKYNIDDLYFIEKTLHTGYRSCLFSMNLQLYERMHDIAILTKKIDNQKQLILTEPNIFIDASKSSYIIRNSERLAKMIQTISDIKL